MKYPRYPSDAFQRLCIDKVARLSKSACVSSGRLTGFLHDQQDKHSKRPLKTVEGRERSVSGAISAEEEENEYQSSYNATVKHCDGLR